MYIKFIKNRISFIKNSNVKLLKNYHLILTSTFSEFYYNIKFKNFVLIENKTSQTICVTIL